MLHTNRELFFSPRPLNPFKLDFGMVLILTISASLSACSHWGSGTRNSNKNESANKAPLDDGHLETSDSIPPALSPHPQPATPPGILPDPLGNMGNMGNKDYTGSPGSTDFEEKTNKGEKANGKIGLNGLKLNGPPRVGLILGPGGARAYGHVGFLRQIQKKRWNISGIVGIEMAAPIAALYGLKEQINDVEWQLFKINDEKIFSDLPPSGKQLSFNKYQDYLVDAFQEKSTQNMKTPFACPALNLNTGKEFMMSRGKISSLLELCTPYPTVFTPWKRNMSAIRSLKSSIDFLRKRGVQYIVLVNVLPEVNRKNLYKKYPGSIEQILWNEISLLYSQSTPGIQSVANLDLGNWDIVDFRNKKEIIAAGEQAAEREVATLSERLGF